MGPYMDFLCWLEPDMSFKVLTYLEDPSDLGRICSVSRTWRHIVVKNGLYKKLCLRKFPQLSRVSHVTELNDPSPQKKNNPNAENWEKLEKEHRVYCLLAHACTYFNARDFTAGDCNLRAISASSTDNYPQEGIQNTLKRSTQNANVPYWSSKGQGEHTVPEMLTYKLESDFVIITEINIHPFRDWSQSDFPIYSAGAVRFHMGHAKSPIDGEIDSREDSCRDDNFEWAYTSQVFPMARVNRLQTFKLPEPVLCMRGILQIELVGSVQRRRVDGLFYIRVRHVQVKGLSLSPAFGVEINIPSGLFVLKNNIHNQPSVPENESDAISIDQ